MAIEITTIQGKGAPLNATEFDDNFINLKNAVDEFMSSFDKTKFDSIEVGAQVNTVTSVASKTGAVTLSKSDVGLSNVDNTSDINKPVSTLTQTALNGKSDIGHNHDTVYLGITAKAADSDKLDGIDSTGFALASHNHNTTYLGIGAKAVDSDKLDGIDSARFVYGANARATTFAVDANAIVKSGLYHLDSVASNIPVVLGGTLVHTQHYNVDNYASQIYHVYSTTDIYKRTCNNGTWSQWEKIAVTASPAFTGTPTAPTAAAGTNTTQLATTAFVNTEINNDRPYEATATNIKMNGTQAVGTRDTVARGDHVHPTDTSRAPLASPALTGTPTAPTQSSSDNSTRIATTSWVRNSMGIIATALGFVFVTGSTGYIKFPSYLGGFILQWGYGVPNASGNLVGTLPVAFPNTHFVGICTTYSEGTPYCAVTTYSLTATNYEFRVRMLNQAAVQQPLFWIAVGN